MSTKNPDIEGVELQAPNPFSDPKQVCLGARGFAPTTRTIANPISCA